MDAASTGSCPRSRRCCSRPRREADEPAALPSIASSPPAGELLPRSGSPASLPEGRDIVKGEAAIFLRVHCIEDPLVTRLKLLQRDGPVTVSVHQDEKHPHIRATQAHTSSAHVGAHRSSTLLLLLRHLWLLLPLLGTRSDSATRQNKSRRREHQNVLLHFISPQKHAPPTNLARAILMRATVA